MKTICSIVGARPQFIKCAAIDLAFRKHFNHVIVHTGQHYDYNMSDQLFSELNIPEPAINLEIGSGLPGWQIGMMMIEFEKYVISNKPDLIIVYGDTNSTAAASIVAVKHQIPLAHIEAGMREFNKYLPEESNKLITDILSDYFFCPTKESVKNLTSMGITDNVFYVGDVMIDLIRVNKEKIIGNTALLNRLNIKPKDYYLLTCHRAINTDVKNNLESILEACSSLDKKVIFPIHPRTKNKIDEFGLNHLLNKNFVILNPLGFFDTQTLIHNACKVITDSGGITKETYYHKVPGILIDNQTEWVETVTEGWNIQAGPNKDAIIKAIKNYTLPKDHFDYVGDGFASDQIRQILQEIL